MIVSHKYRFIFIKTEKTAGTSVEIALSRCCGDQDIITPIVRKDEATRKRLGYRGPQNHFVPLSRYRMIDVVNSLVRRQRLAYYHHMSAREIRRYIGERAWKDYYKFCFERNPYDRIVSFYYWRYKAEPRPRISEFLDSGIPSSLKRKGIALYTIDGEVAVDRVCRFENLEEELEEVRVHLGLPEKLELPRTKSSYRRDKRSYREILGETEKAKIAELFRAEIARFGYDF